MVFIMGFITYALDRSGTVAHLAHFGGAFVAFIIISMPGVGQGRQSRLVTVKKRNSDYLEVEKEESCV
jgi:hypothetical protein